MSAHAAAHPVTAWAPQQDTVGLKVDGRDDDAMPTSPHTFNVDYWITVASVIPVLLLTLAFSTNPASIVGRWAQGTMSRWAAEGIASLEKKVELAKAGGNWADVPTPGYAPVGRFWAVLIGISATVVIGSVAEVLALWSLRAHREVFGAAPIAVLGTVLPLVALVIFAIDRVVVAPTFYRAVGYTPPGGWPPEPPADVGSAEPDQD